MNHHVIIEGPDGIGKSTFIKKLQEHVFSERVHLYASSTVPKTREECLRRIQREHSHPLVVHDRHTAISELVYGILRGGSRITPKESFWSLRKYRKLTILYLEDFDYSDEYILEREEKTAADTPRHHEAKVKKFSQLRMEYHRVMDALKKEGFYVHQFNPRRAEEVEKALNLFEGVK